MNCNPYTIFAVGEMFGHTDLSNNKAFMDAARSFKKRLHVQASGKKKLIPRHFTTRALINCDMMTLALEDLDRMKIEFPDVFFELLEDGRIKLKEHLSEEIKARIALTKPEKGLFGKLGQAMMRKMEKDILEDKPKEKKEKTPGTNKTFSLKNGGKALSFSPSGSLINRKTGMKI
jgi:hypothetical protein